MGNPFSGRSLVDVDTLSRSELEAILDESTKMKLALAQNDVGAYRLSQPEDDNIAALVFAEPSTRTFHSFNFACMRLGMRTTELQGTKTSSLGKGESIKHTAKMFDGYGADVIIMRHPLDGSARYISQCIGKPVFNGGDGKNLHPTQTILDMFTIREHLRKFRGRDAPIEDIDVGFGGDLKHSRVVHSDVYALTKYPGIRFHFFSHELLQMPDYILDDLRARGHEVTVHDSLDELLPNVEFFVQTRSQLERQSGDLLTEQMKLEVWQQTRFREGHMDLTKDEFALMHPLPIYKELPEIDPALDEHPKSIYLSQAENGIPTRMAEIALYLGMITPEGLPDHVWRREEPDLSYCTKIEPGNKKHKDYHLRPIDGGIVVDHLPDGASDAVKALLKPRERGYRPRGGTVPNNTEGGYDSRPEIDMLMIEGMKGLSSEQERIIAVIAPGARVSRISRSRVMEKHQLHMPDVIESDHLQCANYDSGQGTGCISRPEFGEHAPSRFRPFSSNGEREAFDRLVACDYCGNVTTGEEILVP